MSAITRRVRRRPSHAAVAVFAAFLGTVALMWMHGYSPVHVVHALATGLLGF